MNSGSLYAIQFDTGVIKVGKTIHCAKRISEHRKNFQNAGVNIVATYSAPCNAIDKREELFLKRITELGGKVETGREWFSGVKFSDAFSAMDEILSLSIECEESGPKEEGKKPQDEYTETIRAELRNLNFSEVARRSGVHRNLIARFVAGGDIKLSTADKLKAALNEKKPGQQ